jgi:hypothetical protein
MSHEVVPGQFGEFRLDVKPRQIPADRCVDVEVLLFLKLKQRDRGKGLGYRADGEAAVGSHGDMGLQIRIAEYNNLLQILSRSVMPMTMPGSRSFLKAVSIDWEVCVSWLSTSDIAAPGSSSALHTMKALIEYPLIS